MRVVHPEPDHPFDRARIAPLLQVAKVLATSTRSVDARFDPDDFMDLSWCRHDRPPGIKVFKHVLTRQYLYLDDGGRAYQYVVDRPGDLGGRYRRHARLSDAIDNLQLAADSKASHTTIPVIDDDVHVAEAHAELLVEVRNQGNPRGAHDLIIAATAKATDRTIVSAEHTAFEDLPGVAVRPHP